MSTAHEHLSQQFRAWEIRGRGWQVFPGPVSPEPPFVPFAFRAMTDAPAVDTTVRPSFLGSLFRKMASPPPLPPVVPEPEEEPAPTPLERGALVELQVRLPAELDIDQPAMERLLGNLHYCREPVAFELVGTRQKVVAQFVAGENDATLVRKQLSAHFPGVSFRPKSGALERAWEESAGEEIFAVDFGLESEFMLPLASGKLDAYVGIVSALAGLEEGELAVFQVLWQPVADGWAESIVHSVTRMDGKPLFVNVPELTTGAEVKVAKPLYAAVVRMLVRTTSSRRLEEIASEFAGSLRAYANPQGNALIPLHNDDYPFEAHVVDVICRQTRRSGMILNAEELFGFVHIPSEAVQSPELVRDLGKTKAVGACEASGLLLGDNEHDEEIRPVCISPEQRVRHTHIIGIPGSGKSSLLFNLIRQDIESGQGVGVLDPHGDLVAQLLGVIPENRINDVVLVDLSDTEFPVGFNILQAHSEDEKAILASDLVAVLRRFSTSWGDQMDMVLLNAIMVFLDSRQGGTLADLRRFLLEDAYRKQFLQTVTDPELRYYWQSVFPTSGGGKSIGSVLTRLQDFFSRKPLRNLVSQRENKLNFADIMDTGKIFLAKLPEGLNGAENVGMLGSLLVAKFQQTAMARQNQKAADRRDFWLYVDEFDHFISPSMATILTGARKYRLGLTLAHQELHQLSSEPKVASAVNQSVCTRIVLRVGNDDAKRLGERFAAFDARSLANLERFQAVARIERDDNDFNLSLRPPLLPAPDAAERRQAEAVTASRARYGTARAEVERAWLASLGLSENTATTTAIVPGFTPKVAEVREDWERPKVAEPPKAPAIPAPAEGELEGSMERTPSPTIPAKDAIWATPPGARPHETLKDRIAAQAEMWDYVVEPEKGIPGHGQIDLILTRGERSVACEINDTSLPKTEAEHIHLRLKAGFGHVAVISMNRRKLNQIREAYATGYGNADISRVGFYLPSEFKEQLFAWAADDPIGGALERSKPRKQPVNWVQDPMTPGQRQAEEGRLRESLRRKMSANPRR